MNPSTFRTSKEAYEFCLKNGLISQRVAEVLQVMAYSPTPMNQSMAHHAVIKLTGRHSIQKYSVSPRFAVLERMGLIREIGRQPCPFTKRSTVFFEATCQAPVCTEAEACSIANKRETINALKRKVTELEKDNKDLRELLDLRSASYHERERRLKEEPTAIQLSFAAV